MYAKLNLIFWFGFLYIGSLHEVMAGKTAARSGAAAASRIDGSQFNKDKDTVTSKDHGDVPEHVDVLEPRTVGQRLKNDLLRGYDKSVMPLLNSSDSMRIKVGFTYRQVLDLDEKNQILKSLVWYRLFWTDQLLSWDPTDYENIQEIEIPCGQVWMPDIVMYQEIGVRDYSPRLPYAKVRSSGKVSYHEPTVFETSCNIDTAFFPFDMQSCDMTFVSWTQSIIHVDLMTDRPEDKMSSDAVSFFINTGEWRFVKMSVMKKVTDYSSLLNTDSVEELKKEETEKEHAGHISKSAANMISPGVYGVPVNVPVTTDVLGGAKLSLDMFSEVKFTIVLRRNSSLYMQSMLFPSILLTTVAVLGFYLPPDSGERIGLQITILLTFMVFLLAVGEMFPASTGPYLGVYFVICMGLLGLNLLMTVLVLNVHFKPVILNAKRSKQTIKQGSIWSRICNKQGDDVPIRVACNSVVPYRLRQILQFCDRHWSLGEKSAKWMKPMYTKVACDVECVHENEIENLNKSPICSVQLDDSSNIDLSCQENSSSKNDLLSMIDDIAGENSKFAVTNSNDSSTKSIKEANGTKFLEASSPSVETNQESENGNQQTVATNLLEKNVNDRSTNSSERFTQKPNKARTKHGSIFTESNVLANVKNYIHTKALEKQRKRDRQGRIERKKWKSVREEREEMQSLEQEEWKSVARAIDTLFFRVYVFFIIISHVGLAIAAFHSWCAGERLG